MMRIHVIVVKTVIVTLILWTASRAEDTALAGDDHRMPSELKKLFSEEEALRDQDGKEIVTRLGNPHPIIMDWNNDGRNDLLLASQEGGRNTYDFALYFLENVGSNSEPRFKWPCVKIKHLKTGEKFAPAGCG